MPDLWRFRADFAKHAAAVLVARLVVHGPEAFGGVAFGEGEPMFRVLEPLLDLRFRAEGEASREARKSDSNLRCVDDNASDRGLIDDSSGHTSRVTFDCQGRTGQNSMSR
jgi:hypothetical protein